MIEQHGLSEIDYIRTTAAIRERCGKLYDLALAGRSKHFEVDISRLPQVVDRVEAELLRNYPALDVPYHSRWRHFVVDNVDKIPGFNDRIAHLDPYERAQVKVELAIVSVLLDAGSGDRWSYIDPESGKTMGRSEGLAVASLHAFENGAFGGKAQATGAGLLATTVKTIENAFQVTPSNPLAGIEGRAALLNQLGAVVVNTPAVFGENSPRLGNFLNVLRENEVNGAVRATDVLKAVVTHFSAIWPGRITLEGENLGDVWRHSSISTNDRTDGLVPFHKLSQWLSYSLFEPLEELGLKVIGINELTGLAEYRNGGLYIDGGVLRLRDPDQQTLRHQPGSELIVEWRALTIALLDITAERLREKLGKTQEELSLAKVLQGGTWSAGRVIAAELRSAGGPPIQIESDGTVF